MPLHREPEPARRPALEAAAYAGLALAGEVAILAVLGGVLLHKAPAKGPAPRKARPPVTAELVTRHAERPAIPPPAPIVHAQPPTPRPAHLAAAEPARPRAPVAAISLDPSRGRKGSLDEALASANEVEPAAESQPAPPPPAAIVPAAPPPPVPQPVAPPAAEPASVDCPAIHLPDDLQAEAMGAAMMVQFTVLADGTCSRERLSSTGYDDIDAYVMSLLDRCRCHPAVAGGSPVVRQNIVFGQ